ncbi:hypothetical protein MKX07_000725 [Trichoderma sp. CBMAI-0711]|nr:hypothetical protein MKX07_000725 [Trichoderma sp. CBMAI-0711]
MALSPPPLPSRFPCWCRAIYSWGGESKHDLGFIEGDLIECLNAGDGSCIPIQVGAAKVEDVPKTIRSLCQGAALYHSKTAGNVSGDANVACKREAVSGGNDDITIKGELDADP